MIVLSRGPAVTMRYLWYISVALHDLLAQGGLEMNDRWIRIPSTRKVALDPGIEGRAWVNRKRVYIRTPTGHVVFARADSVLY